MTRQPADTWSAAAPSAPERRPVDRQIHGDLAHRLRTPLTELRLQLEEAVLYPHAVDPQTMVRAALQATDRLEAAVLELLSSPASGRRPV